LILVMTKDQPRRL